MAAHSRLAKLDISEHFVFRTRIQSKGGEFPEATQRSVHAVYCLICSVLIENIIKKNPDGCKCLTWTFWKWEKKVGRSIKAWSSAKGFKSLVLLVSSGCAWLMERVHQQIFMKKKKRDLHCSSAYGCNVHTQQSNEMEISLNSICSIMLHSSITELTQHFFSGTLWGPVCLTLNQFLSFESQRSGYHLCHGLGWDM